MRRPLHAFTLKAGRSLRHVSRWTLYACAGLLLLLGAAALALRLMLPALAQQKSRIEEFLSERSGQLIRIAEIEAQWQGWRPVLRARGLEVFSPTDLTRAVRLSEIRISLALAPLLWRELRVYQLVLVRPTLSVERLADGRIEVSGLAPVPVPAGKGRGFLPWLLAQRQLVIEEGELQWFDHLGERHGLYVSNINADLYNRGSRHRFSLTARFPPALCGDCAFSAELRGDPLTPKELSGRVFVKALAFDLEALPAALRERMAPALAGKFDLRLWTTWRDGRLHAAEGDVNASALRLPLPRLPAGVGIEALRSNVRWSRTGKDWQLNLEDLWLGLAGPARSIGHVRLAGGPRGRRLRIDTLELADLSRFIAMLELEHQALALLRELHPVGRVDGFSVKINGKGETPEDYAVEAAIHRLHTEPVRKIPGVRNLSGRLNIQGRRGSFVLAASELRVSMPQILRAPVDLHSASGRLRFAIDEERWELQGEDLQAAGEDGRAKGRLQVKGFFGRPGDRPYLNLQVDFSDGNGANAKRYFPLTMSPRAIAWLDQAIVGGRVTRGSLRVDGDLNDFPFVEGNGTFEVQAQIREAAINYLPGWAPLTQADGELLFRGPGMLIRQERGRIGDLQVREMVVRSENLRKESNPRVLVDGKIEGSLTEVLRVLRAVPASAEGEGWRSYLDLTRSETGSGVIGLRLEIPTQNPGDYLMDGEYTVDNASLQFRVLQIRAERLVGQIRFDRFGPFAGELRGRMLGGEVELEVSRQTQADGRETLLSGRGSFTAPAVAQLFPWHFTSYLDGYAPWTGKWRFGQGPDRLQLIADLRPMRSRLPAPLERPSGITQQLNLSSEPRGSSAREVRLSIGEQIHGHMLFAKRPDGEWDFARGGLGLGTALPPDLPRMGLRVDARAPHIDADPWFAVFGLGGRGALPDYLRALTGEFDSVLLLGRGFGKIAFDVTRGRDVWEGTLDGTEMQGRIRVVEGHGLPVDRLELELKRLQLPPRAPQAGKVTPDPRVLPSLRLQAERLGYQEREFGVLDIHAERAATGWNLSRLTLTRPETTLILSGAWSVLSGVERTRLELQLTSFDMGTTLEAWGMPEHMAGGKLNIGADLAWRGPPFKPEVSTLEGSARLSGEKGRFLRLRPGAARLFGALDFSAIGKLFTGDFGSLFGKGLAFEQLSGDLSIERGDVHTSNLQMTGPMQLAFNGRMGLAKKDVDLAVKATPSLGTNIGLWGILGPQGGLILLALEKMFKKQFAAGTSLTYLVKGPWDNPQVERLGEPPKAPSDAEAREPG